MVRFIVILAIIGAAVYFLFFIRKKYEKRKDKIQEEEGAHVEEKEKPKSEAEVLQDLLIDLNTKLRIEAINEDVIQSTESIIDSLLKVIPTLNEEHPGSELTWVVNKMAKSYLINLLEPYFTLSGKSRSKQKEELLSTLAALREELEKIIKMIESQQISEFQTQATFLSRKFFSGAVEA